MGHILVVDDHKTNRLKLSLGVKQQGHTVETAENGRQALEMLRSQTFDLMLLDIMMPEMDGYQVLSAMKAEDELRHIPVIVISAQDEMESVVRGIELGAEDYLPKSFEPVLLRARIEACLEKKRLRDNEQLYLKGLERELDIGRRIQQSFLPEVIPQPPAWDIAAYFQAAREVAGDFYDVFSLPPQNKVGLVLGDVCSKGVGAALFMALFRSLIRALANTDEFVIFELPLKEAVDDAAILKNTLRLTNNYIAKIHQRANMFASLFFGLLDPTTGRLTYSNAGHEPPLIIGPGGVKAHLAPTGPVAGIFFGLDFEVQVARLEPGDTLLAFTDGVTEAFNVEGEMFSLERLSALLKSPQPSATALLEHIVAALGDYTSGMNQSDDITMLAARRSQSDAW